MNELVSIIIPVYNHAETIVSSLASIIEQTYRPIEVIIVDDGSTDDLDFVIKPYLEKINSEDISFKLIKQINAGAPAARNNGYEHSSGQYIIFFDADTVAKPEMIEKLHDKLAVTNFSFAYSAFKYGFKTFLSREFDASELKKNNYIDVSALIRREDFPGFDRSLKRFQDWDLWLSMLEKNKTGIYLPEVLYRKITGGRSGMSRWLPRFFYHLPFKTKSVRSYENSKKIVQKKHGLI